MRPRGLAARPPRAPIWRTWSMLMMTTGQAFEDVAAGPEARVSGPTACRGAKDHAPRAEASTEAGLLELAIDALGELVETFVDGHLLGDHLLQRCRPLGCQIEEQR